ncbi:MAG: ABC transporter ATP-binding protein [Nitrospirota bacterium]
MADHIVDIDRVGKRFKDVWAVSDLSFAVGRGEIVGLLGPNGAGKTTTLSMLLALLIPTTGRIRLFGLDVASHRQTVLSRMNFSSPYADLPHRLTVRENLLVYGRLYGVSRLRETIADLAQRLDIAAFLDRRFGELSSGQRTRVALAKALINAPELLLLDEPTASLDPDVADRVRTWLAEYRATTGAAILLSSHNMSEVERLCDRVIVLQHGRCVDQDTPARLIQRYGRESLEDVFLAIARKDRDP